MRRKTVSVNVGIVDIGSNHSIKTQSMTTASTLDTNASVEEAIRIIDAGGKLVRFTAPNTKEAENLENIKSAIRKKGYETPFVADIHFVPKAALVAAKIVEKYESIQEITSTQKDLKMYSTMMQLIIRK